MWEYCENRFEPHQHFYSAQVHQGCFVQIYDMNEEETQRYLKGNLLPVTGYRGIYSSYMETSSNRFLRKGMEVC